MMPRSLWCWNSARPSGWSRPTPRLGQDLKARSPAWGVDTLRGVLKRWRAQAEKRIGGPVKVGVIQEAARDGFSVHPLLEEGGAESWVVDPASIAVDRRKRPRRI